MHCEVTDISVGFLFERSSNDQKTNLLAYNESSRTPPNNLKQLSIEMLPILLQFRHVAHCQVRLFVTAPNRVGGNPGEAEIRSGLVVNAIAFK